MYLVQILNQIYELFFTYFSLYFETENSEYICLVKVKKLVPMLHGWDRGKVFQMVRGGWTNVWKSFETSTIMVLLLLRLARVCDSDSIGVRKMNISVLKHNLIIYIFFHFCWINNNHVHLKCKDVENFELVLKYNVDRCKSFE
jgi:hypothetical protein